jgi:hypothetical protein
MQETSMMMNMYQQQQQLQPESLAIAQLLNEQQSENGVSSLNNGNNLATIQRLLQQQRQPDERFPDFLPNPSRAASNEEMTQQIQHLNILQQQKEELRLRMLIMQQQQQQGSIETLEPNHGLPPAALLSLQDQQQLNDDDEGDEDDDDENEGENDDDDEDIDNEDDDEDDNRERDKKNCGVHEDTKVEDKLKNRKHLSGASDDEYGDDDDQRRSIKKQRTETEV